MFSHGTKLVFISFSLYRIMIDKNKACIKIFLFHAVPPHYFMVHYLL